MFRQFAIQQNLLLLLLLLLMMMMMMMMLRLNQTWLMTLKMTARRHEVQSGGVQRPPNNL